MDPRWWSCLGAGACVLVAAGPSIAQPAGTAPAVSAAPSKGATPSLTLPRVLSASRPVYPERALGEGLRSVVKVELAIEIDAEGKVLKATVVSPQGHGFDEAAVKAAESTTFEPARRDGTAIAAKIRFEVVLTPPAKEEKTQGPKDAPPKGGPGGAGPAASAEPAPAPEPASAQPVVDVSVYGERAPRDVTKRTLTMEEIGLIPGTNGDALRSLQSMPGVARTLPTSGLLVVRGAAPRDTNILVDGTPVPIVYHLGGLSSVLPTEVLGKIDFYPGNYSAAYGRRMGGFVDVGVRAPRDDGIHALAQLDLVDARVLAEAPVFKTGWKVLVAGRRSWFDAWLTPILKATSQLTATSVYYDYQVLLQKDLTPTSSVRVLFFGSDDRVQVVNAPEDIGAATSIAGLDYHTSFWRIQARYEDRISDRTEIRAVLAGGQDTGDYKEGESRSLSSNAPVSARLELSQKVARGVIANVGIDVALGPYVEQYTGAFSSGDGTLTNGASTDIDRSGFRFFAASYTEWELRPWRGMRVVPGLRLDYASTTKSWDVSPRVLARQDLTRGFPRTTLKGGVGLFYQPPSAAETDPVLGQTGLVSNRALQTDFGLEQELTPQLELSVDFFHRQLDHLVATRLGNVGDGVAFGAEWLLRYKPDERFFGWLAYTISRSEQRYAPESPSVLTTFDQTHILTILGSYALPYGFRAGLRFRLVSGNPYTPYRPGIYDATTGRYSTAVDYPPNQARLPLFHDLNLRVDKRFQWKSWALTAYLDIQNVYNQSNVEGILYNYSYTRQADVLGLPIIPSVGLRGEL